MIKPLYNISDRIMLRRFPDSFYSKNILLDMRKKHLFREFQRILMRLK